MGKSDRLNILRHKKFLLQIGGSFAAVLAVTSAIFTIAGWHLEIAFVIPFALAALLLSVFLTKRAIRAQFLPVEDLPDFNADTKGSATLICPCGSKLRSQAKQLAAESFARDFVIDPNIYEQLWLKNNYILTCLCDQNEIVHGYFDVIPVRSSFAIPLLKGRIHETQMTHDDVLSPHEMEKCEYLYIAGIAVRNPEAYLGRQDANILVWGLFEYLKKFYGFGAPLLIAIASTEPGKGLLKRFKMQWENGPRDRVDGGDLYVLKLTKQELDDRQARLPDWSNLCVRVWDGKSNVVRLKDVRRPRRPAAPKEKQIDISDTGSASSAR
ncbi:MAG TPA: hypothetical protein VG889_14055 [Rhizomicrobium sp.]|nr:hypothetical protein [Rhizomicrobium sp.]